MRRHTWATLLLAVVLSCLLAVGTCLAGSDDEIPITTKSKKAKELFIKGRDLNEKLRFTDARPYFQKAVAEDPNFALAHFGLAQVATSAKGFFENMERAVELVGTASEGERLLIMGANAGQVSGDPIKQQELFTQLVKKYPKDKRARTLLGNAHFGQQDWETAITHYEKAIDIDSKFSPPYNQMGYAHSSLGNFGKAEYAFKNYINLIPDDPNPYDSYAELLTKAGRYEESITNYRKALAVDPKFIASYIGIATNLNLLGRHEEARRELRDFYAMAENDGQRRTVYQAMAVSYADQGKLEHALVEVNKQYALAERIGDKAAMSADLTTAGNIQLELGLISQANSNFDTALELILGSNLGTDVKDQANIQHTFNMARVALERGNVATATNLTNKLQQTVEPIGNPNQIKQVHQLRGMIALETNDYTTAVTELRMSNLQNPYNLFRLSIALESRGDRSVGRGELKKAAEFNVVNSLNYALIRDRANQALTQNVMAK